MRRLFWLAVVLFAPVGAVAQTCPDFYRFVDFGLPYQVGDLHRGGPVFRAEGFDGEVLLDVPATECLAVTPLSWDGHGNPMPVVARISYAVEEIGLPFDALYVVAAEDSVAQAEAAARQHRDVLSSAGAQVVRGTQSLCVAQDGEVSCQVTSPYGGQAPVVAYCGPQGCHLPVLALSERLIVEARWTAPLTDIEAMAEGILDRITAIEAFLTPISAGY